MNTVSIKFFAVVALVIVALGVSFASMDNEQHAVERALAAQGLTNATVKQSIFVACLNGGKGRYGYKWSAYRNGQPVDGEACSGGLFQKTVIKP